MIPDIHIVFDCADPDRLARFWMVALSGYDARIEAVGSQLVAAGGSIYRRVDNEEGFWLVMQDPEGNEFCVN